MIGLTNKERVINYESFRLLNSEIGNDRTIDYFDIVHELKFSSP